MLASLKAMAKARHQVYISYWYVYGICKMAVSQKILYSTYVSVFVLLAINPSAARVRLE